MGEIRGSDMSRWAIPLVTFSLVASCTSVGPRTGEILGASQEIVTSRQTAALGGIDAARFVVVEADRNVAFTWQRFEETRAAFFADPGPGQVTIQSGDVLSITLVSTTENGGFVDFTTNSLSPIATTALPSQRVTELGTINVPPIGRVEVRGRTLPDIENFLDSRLSEVLVNPSVVVDLVQRNNALVSVVGAVGAPGSFAYTSGTARLLDLISLAGGASSDIQGLDISLSRNGSVRRVALSDVYRNSGLNVHIRPGDTISVEPRNHSVVVLGAAGENTQVAFNTQTISLARLLGQVGGIENRRADPKGIFIYRPTPRRLAGLLGIDISNYPGDNILVVYRFNIEQPAAFFTLSEFDVRNGDILYVANSRYEQIDAALDIFSDAVVRPITFARTIEGNN